MSLSTLSIKRPVLTIVLNLTIILFGFIVFLCYKFGYRWMKGKKQEPLAADEIDSLGEN